MPHNISIQTERNIYYFTCYVLFFLSFALGCARVYGSKRKLASSFLGRKELSPWNMKPWSYLREKKYASSELKFHTPGAIRRWREASNFNCNPFGSDDRICNRSSTVRNRNCITACECTICKHYFQYKCKIPKWSVWTTWIKSPKCVPQVWVWGGFLFFHQLLLYESNEIKKNMLHAETDPFCRRNSIHQHFLQDSSRASFSKRHAHPQGFAPSAWASNQSSSFIYSSSPYSSSDSAAVLTSTMNHGKQNCCFSLFFDVFRSIPREDTIACFNLGDRWHLTSQYDIIG